MNMDKDKLLDGKNGGIRWEKIGIIRWILF